MSFLLHTLSPSYIRNNLVKTLLTLLGVIISVTSYSPHGTLVSYTPKEPCFSPVIATWAAHWALKKISDRRIWNGKVQIGDVRF